MLFNEHSLRADIAKTFGEFGAHVEVFDMLYRLRNELEVSNKELIEALDAILMWSAHLPTAADIEINNAKEALNNAKNLNP